MSIGRNHYRQPLDSGKLQPEVTSYVCVDRPSKIRCFCAIKTSVLKFCARKKCKNITKNHLIKRGLNSSFLVCACKFQDFAQSHKIFTQSHDRETGTLRNSVCGQNIS